MGEPRLGPGRYNGLNGNVDLDRDRDLVTRAQSGDVSAFDELFVLYRKRLRQACLGRLGDPEEAEDVAQEAFARAWRALPGFNGERKFYSWLAVIAANLCTDVLRRRSVSSRFSVEVGDLELASPDDSGEDLIVVAAERELAKRALRCLPQRQKRLIQLREQSGWSYDEIAHHEGLSSNSIETLMSRARQALKREFARLSEVDRFSVSALAALVSLRLRRLFGAARHGGLPGVQHVGYVVAGAAVVLAASPVGPFHSLEPGSGPVPAQQAPGLMGPQSAAGRSIGSYDLSSQRVGTKGASGDRLLTAEMASPEGWLAALTGDQSLGLMGPFMSVIADLGAPVKSVESTITRWADGLDAARTTANLALGDLLRIGAPSSSAQNPCCHGSSTSGGPASSPGAEGAQSTNPSGTTSQAQSSTQAPTSSSGPGQQPSPAAAQEQYPGNYGYYGYYGDQPNSFGPPGASGTQPQAESSPSAAAPQQDSWTGPGAGSGTGGDTSQQSTGS